MFNWIKRLLKGKEYRLKEDIDNFMRRQPPIKILNLPRDFVCCYCRKDYKAIGTQHYIIPLCMECSKDVEFGHITKEELENELELYNEEEYANRYSIRKS